MGIRYTATLVDLLSRSMLAIFRLDFQYEHKRSARIRITVSDGG
ncbi:hypothetical protein AN5967.2 [Aspergillus nidulans FGSC A4]|uniref:Uncharacterized protein n=1 Tax=Emericella nidulans (strain FGSC A4 / ATCC 38163 / CBS 112.46 / NRRL 194 / M139) TaxID=227321 RepID=Q5B0G3_EMENI|nr:hypothetical protein [Aspergillus nidulans FGSC A4]EAA57716.1 hypothetical protein AN5967.2 [Aspergillus nidulans FGSC A4]CBF70455.1 TPA: hypothetical protein ANIA_05967 [Aspergillus nidulans FGSC A4]|eukprot:XP_663571.1 hypothetical protein AN5967.2 [Aspergillus nidulans FGSC A4]